MSCSASAWIDREFDAIQLGDERLNRRFKQIAKQLARHCGKTLASSFREWKTIKASYRFFANERVSEQEMLAPHQEQTVDRIKHHDTVLLLQDSTYLDYNNRPKTKGLDFTFRSKLSTVSQGLILHNTLAITDDSIPLGLVDQTFIDRKTFHGKDHEESRKVRNWNRPIEEKESQRWIDVVRKCHHLDFGQAKTIHIADRECDIYEFFRDAAGLRENVLVRASKNRSINKGKRREPPSALLFDYLKAKKAQGRVTVTIQVNGKKKYRDAELSIVYRPITMPPPPNKTVKKDGPNLPMVPLYAIMAIERRPPKNQSGIFWVLLTNMEVDNLDEAIEKVRWYSLRWNIEVFHKVLKSGCGVEDAQLRHADRLKKYIVLKSIIAWRLFWLARAHENNKEESCSTVLSEVEWTILYRKAKKSRNSPNKPPTIGEALVWIAKLGGYIGRNSDPPPGMISLWRGWQRLMDMVDDFNDIYG
jgi:hypothetical protein